MTTETANQSQTDASTAFLRAARAGQLDKILALLNQDVDINVSNANGLNAMHLASKDGHSEVVSVLLQRGAHIDAATKKGNTALHIAALAGQEAVVRLLVQNAAQVNIQSQNGFTPLYMAAQENHDGVVKFLLANGANQSLATEDGFTPLAVAMQQGHEKVVAVLLEADTGRVRLPALHIAAKKDDCKAAALLLENDHNPDVTSKSGFTPLHIAAHYGNEAVARLLLTKGADVNCAAKHNICPLHVAAKWGKANMVALLAESGAQVEARTRDGLTPLHCAARSGHEHVVDMLLERGAPISGKSKNGLAPLHMAAQGDHSDAARILLYHRAPVDDLTVDYLTALHVAAHCGHVKVAKLLLDRNADANARALNGFTPLHIACKKNRIKVVELLLKYGASISATTESGLTPLHVAAFMGCMNIVIYLLQHEASPDVPTVRGETPLHLAARANQTDIIRILLRNGAAVDARAREMQTALHIASRLGNVDIVLLLVQHGAQLDALTADNYNALHIAAKQHNHEVAAVLLEHGAPPNAVTKKGFTPLHLAAKYGNLKVANLLMSQKDAELDPRGKNGVTPLHVAAQYKHHAVATALLEKGADPKAAAKNGHTALHIAARKNQMETAAALMERGAVVDAESRAGCTPLHLAAHQGHAEMCSLLMEQGAEAGKRARSGLAALHLSAQEDHVPVAKILVNNGAKVDVCTKGGYTPLHVASHFGQTNMVKFLLESDVDVQATTCHGYTALHHAAQQGHINIVNLLLEHKADANATTNNGQTPLDIAQRLGYVTVMDTLKGVSESSPSSLPKDDKYKPVAPETMYETFMSDSEEEGGEDTMLTDQPYRYLTVDDMKSLGDDSLPIDVTRDERVESVIGSKNVMDVSQDSTTSGPPYVIDELTTAKTVNHLYNAELMKEGYCYNVDATQPKRKLQWKNFLVSFLVDARGGALKGCRGGGVRVIVPPLSAQQPTRITCRYVRSQRVSHMPPLMEGEALASRVLELGPVSAKFIGPIILEVPHFASLRGKEREIVILRSDNGTTWREHAVEAADCTVQDILSDTLDIDEPPEEPGAPPARVTRILTHDFPQYFAVISRIRQEVHAIGPEGGMVSSSVVPQVQAVFPQGALTKKIKVGLQAQTIEADLTAKLLGRGVAVSPVVTVEPRRRKFHKAITLSMPAPRPHSQGMINQYTTSAPTLRLLCSISGGTNRAHWEDVTDSTPLTFVNDCVSFTTTVSARYWLMDCRNVSEATKMATELYREAIHVPFMARFVVYAKRTEQLQANLRVFCVTDDREDKTLERMERFSQVAKSKDVEVHEGKPVFLEFGGNFSPVAKSGEQPRLEFKALRENRLQLAAMVRGAHADAVARCQFMREARRPKGEPSQTPICVLNILLPEEVIHSDVSLPIHSVKETITVETYVHAEEQDYKWPEKLNDARITSMCNLLGMDWVPLAYELGVSSATVASIKERGLNGAQQGTLMLQLWRSQREIKAHDNSLELALCRIGREDVLVPQSIAETERRIQRNIYQERQSSEEIIGYKSPESDMELLEKDRMDNVLLEQEDINKAFDKNEAERRARDILERKDVGMDDSIGEREEAKYSPEEKSYVDEGSDREPSLSISEESEEEEGIKKSVAERKIQITRKLSSGKVPASKQKRELKEEIIEIKKQINPEIKKFHVQQSTVVHQESKESVTKLSKKSSSEEEDFVKPMPVPVPQAEPPKERVLPKAGPRPMQKHVRNDSMIRFSSGDFSDVKVPQKKQEEKIVETKEEMQTKEVSSTIKTEIIKETTTRTEESTKTVTTKEEIITVNEKDIAEAPLKEKISSFESKMLSEKTKAETDKFEHKVKLTEEALKKHEEMQKTTTEYTEEFILDQIRVHDSIMSEKLIEEQRIDKVQPADPGSPDLVSDFAAEMMKAEETFRAAADHTSEKYTETYFKGTQHVPKTFTKASRTDSTIVQFSSEEDTEFLKKSTDSETETESQIVTVKQQVGLLEGQIGTTKSVVPSKLEKIVRDTSSSDLGPKSPLTIHIERESVTKFLEDEISSIEHEAVKIIKETDSDALRVDSLEDSLQISSDEDAQIQPTDDESESHIKDQLLDESANKSIEAKHTVTETKITSVDTHARSDSMGSDFSKRSTSEGPQIESSRSPKHLSQESPLPYSQATVDRTDSLADSVQSTERDMSYTSQSDSKVYSKDTRPTRSDSLDEASQFSDMEETQIGAPLFPGSDISSTKITTSSIRNDTMKFLENEYKFSSTELHDKSKKTEKSATDEPAISAKARQFIETVPEDDSSVHDCFFSKRIYSDSLEESEQYVTDNESRRPSEADSLKSDKSDQSGKDTQYKMSKISSEIEEGLDENIDSSVIIDDEPVEPVAFEFVKMKKEDSKEDEGMTSPPIVEEASDVAQDNLFKKMSTTKRHSRNESISIINFTPAELKDTEEKLIPPEIPKRATEFQMFVTEAADDFGDERISSFEREELSDKISSESSREIEISEKKWSDGGTSDRISSEDAVTDKRSSESIKEDLKISTDTLLGADTKSPDLVVDDDLGSPTSSALRRESPTLRKVDKVFTGLKELADQPETALPKLDDALKTSSQSPGMNRASLGSAGEGSYDLFAGKRASDALSITDSRDYTFEESEDSIPHKETKQELENRAKAILEPIYDKALRAVRGDSLDDVEPFCMDQESDSPRLPGIQETQQNEVFQTLSSTLVTDDITIDRNFVKIPITMDISKDVDKDYSVQSSPDEVEEKICTDTESELDQAKVLEIIEPTSDADNGFIPSFDTSRLKQDSLDDADDFFAEKEGTFDNSEISTQHVTTETKPDGTLVTTTTTTIHKTITGPVKEVTKTVESEIMESISQTTEILTKDLEIIKSKLEGTEVKDESIKSESLSDNEMETEKDDYISRSISEVGAAVAASIGIFIKPEDFSVTKETKDSTTERITTLKSSSSKESVAHQEHHLTELMTDVSSTIAKSAGMGIKPEASVHKIEHDHSITELISDASITLAASVGVDVKSEHDEKEVSTQKIITKEISVKHPVVELLSDASTTLAASVGLEYRHEGEEIIHEHPITELLSDSSSTLAAAVGIDFKPERDMFLDDKEVEISKTSKTVVSESKIASSISKTVEYTEHMIEKIDSISKDKKPKDIKIVSKDDEASPDLSPDGLDDREKIVSEIKDLNRSDRRCSDLLEGISQPGGSLIRIDTSHVTHELSLKFSKTPPPSPVDLINRGASAEVTGQQRKGPDVHTLDQASKLSPRDARFIKEIVSSDGDRLHSGYISEASKDVSRSMSPKSPIRHHSGDIAFVNVESLTMHPDTKDLTSILEQGTTKLISKDSKVVTEVITTKSDTYKVDEKLEESVLIGVDSSESSFDDAKANFKEETQKKFNDIKKDFKDDVVVKFEHLKQEFDDTKKMFEDFSKDDDATMIITKKESSTHQISGKEVFSEKKQISSSDDDSIISAKIETKHEIFGEEYELKQKESFEKSGDTVRTEKSSIERDQKASTERRDSELQKAKKGDDDSAVIITHREFSEQGLYSGRQSKSEEKMTAIKDEVSRKSEVSYSERDLSHETWGKEYFTERTELEPTEEVEAEFSQGQDIHIESAVRIVEKDQKLTSEEVTQSGKIVSTTTGFSKEESIVESKEHDDMSSDISQDTSFKSEVAGKRDSFDDKSEMSPKSRSRSLKKEEVYEVDFIKELKISTSQKSKGSSQEISQDTHSESEMIGESDFIGIPQLDLIPDDDKKSKKEQINKEKKISPVHKSEEHIQEHVWEVSLQQQESLDEVASDLHHQSKSFCEEPKSVDLDFVSQSESKSLTSGSDLGITTLASDLDLRISQSGISITSSDETYCAEAPSEALDSFRDSMIKSRESIETEYMIKSIDSQDTETLQKSMESMSVDMMQQSEKDDFSTDVDFFTTDLHQKRFEQKLLKEKSLEDICSSGYDTDLSSAEFLASKLEHERVDVEPLRPQPLAELSDLEKTIDEVKQSLEAAHGEIINEKSDGSIKYKQSPSEFEFKLISPDRPEVIHEEPLQHPENITKQEQDVTVIKTVTSESKTQTSVSSKSEESHEVKKDYSDVREDYSIHSKTVEFSIGEKDISTSTKDTNSSSKHDDTCFTSDEEKDTIHEKDKYMMTQHEISDISTGLESGPMSLVDTENEMASDKEESPKDSSDSIKLRPVQKHLKSAHIMSDRRSGSDIEGWSSSGESHYQSFEHTDSPHSRPLSSDVEILLTGTAEFQSALTTQDVSTKSQRTSKDYVTAASTLSSRGSVKSLDSESSGHVASIDISDASETLVPSAAELKEELIESGNLGDQMEAERNKIKQTVKEVIEESFVDVKSKEDLENDNVQKTSSLEGLSQSEEGSLDDEINVSIDASSCKMKRSHEMSFQPKELLPEKFPSESLSESADLDIELEMPESDSQVFSMSKIETGPSTIRRIKESTEISNTSSSKTSEPSKSYEISEKTVEYRTSSVVYKTPEKKPKPVEVEKIVERKVVTVKAEPMPVHISSAPKQEVDFDSLMAEIIPKGTSEYEEIVSAQVLKSHSGTTVSSSSSSEKKTPEPYPIDSKQSSSSSLKIQDDHLSTPQTPISNPSQSSESTDNGREYVLDDMYEISEDHELFQSDRATDSKSEISITTEERTLYETQKEPDSPTSDEFEMVDKPSEIDDFVVIEEVAKEASEFDAEGKSVSIGKAAFVKKHDEEVENYLSQTTKKSNETEYSTSGSLSEEELNQYELEQRRLRAAENAEIEAGKKWIQMQFEGDLAAARYEYDRGPLEDIKEEEMTDFDASRIGSFTSQKESVGSYGSIKNSFGSLSESDIMLRRRYMMRSGEQDDVSVSSLQEFENLEQILSLEAYQHSSSSQDSLNGSLPRRYHRGKNTQGDDVSMSSLKEFEGLESACLEALKIEIQAKQKEALLLSQDGRLSSAGFLDMEKRSYSHGSSESSPPQKSGSSPGQKSGSPSQKSGSPSQKSGSPGQKSGSPGQKYGSPSQKALADAIAIRKMIDQQMAEGSDLKTSTAVTGDGTTITYVTSQKKVYDNKGAFYVPDTMDPICSESVCTKKSSYECRGQEPDVIKTSDIEKASESDLGSSFTEADANMIGVITTTKVIQQRFVDGKKVSENIITSSGKGMDIPGAAKEDHSGEYGSGSFPSIEVGSGASMGDYGSEFSSSITSQQSDTESLVTMMEKPCDSEHGSELGSMERLESITVTTKVIVSPRQLDLDLTSKQGELSEMREISPMSGKSGSGAFSSTASKHFTDPASGSWSGLDEDMSSSGSFSRVEENEVTLTSTSRAKEEDMMLGSTDSLEQTSSNATRATYNYEVDTPMTGSLTSAGSNTMVSSLDTLEPVTAFFEKGSRALGLSTEDCFTMDHSGSDHLEEYEVQEPDSDSDKHLYGKPQARERTIMFEGRNSSEDSSSGKGGATFFIGDTPIVKGDKSSSESSSAVTEAPPIAAQRKSLTGITKPIVLEQHKPKDDDKDNENV